MNKNILSLFLAGLLILALVPVGSSSASPDAPLSVYVKEYISATIEADGEGTNCGVWNVTGYITVNNTAGENVYDIWVPISSSETVSLDSSPGYATVQQESPPQWIQDTYPTSGYGSVSDYTWWHITELHDGDSVVFKYTKTSGLPECPPITVSETYDPQKIVDGQSSEVTVDLTITNGFSDSVSIKVKKVLPADNTADDGWENTADNPVFTSAGTPDAGASGLSTDNKELYWTSDGSWPGDYITVSSGGSITLTGFKVQGTPDLSEVGGATRKIGMGNVYVYFTLSKSYTGTKVGYVYAIGKGSLEVKKKQDTTNPDTWYETLVVYDTSGVFNYELLNATVWATEGYTPASTLIYGSMNTQQEHATSPIATLTPGDSYTYGPYDFTYELVPKVWGHYKAIIQRDETSGWMNYTNTTVIENDDGTTKYMVSEKIWVVKGYLIKARKEVRPGTATGEFCIGIKLENVGEWMTPYVEFYDLVPSDFSPYPSGTEGDMVFYPLSMLAQDANPSSSPPDYSQITSPTGYTKGYVWKTYPIPVARGFAEWFPDTSTSKSITVKMKDGSTRTWTVQVVDGSTVSINGTSYTEGNEFLADSADDDADTYFLVAWVQDSVTSGGGYVVVSAKGHYENLDMDVYNPVFVHYCVQGSGDYKIPDIFVVGVDPRNTLDANAIFMPFTAIGLGATNMEIWFIVAVVVLVAAELLMEIRGRRRREPLSPMAHL